jgi:hypothetical protein
MKIDLSKVVGYSKDCLQSRALMRAIISDLYPNETREMNVLLDIYESGVPKEIKNMGNITASRYLAYIQRIVNDYGLQEQYVIDGLNAWIALCLGKEKSAEFATAVQLVTSNATITIPISHNKIVPNQALVVTGSVSDYELSCVGNNEYEISKFIGFDEENMVIPNVIDGKKIIGVGEAAYKSCIGIKTLVIAEGITYLRKEAFSNCKNLYIVTLPTTLNSLGDYAFSKTAIRTLNFPNGIKVLHSGVCSGCINLQSVILPDSLEEIGNSVFYNTGLTSIVLPNTVKKIGWSAFERCYQLSQVDLNEGLEYIGVWAFKECKTLRCVTFPKTVVKFGVGIFWLSSDVIIKCYPGSRASEYAWNNGLTVKDASKG